MVRESFPQTLSGWTESPISHTGTCGSLWDEELLEVRGFVTINALVCEEGELVLNPE